MNPPAPGPGSHDRDRLRGLYQRLLALYPADFRARYELDLLQAFDDRREEARFSGTIGGTRLLLFLARDFVTSVPLARTSHDDRRGVAGIMNDIIRDLRFSVRMLLKNPANVRANLVLTPNNRSLTRSGRPISCQNSVSLRRVRQ